MACGARPIERQRQKIVPLAEGRVLELGFGSAHPGAFSAVMGDGSVKSIPLGATPSVLLSLGRRNDGVSVDPESL